MTTDSREAELWMGARMPSYMPLPLQLKNIVKHGYMSASTFGGRGPAINHWATHYIIYKMWISAGLLALSEDHGENILNPCHEVKRQKQRCSHINWVAATPPPACVSEVFNKHVLQTLRKSQSQIYTNKWFLILLTLWKTLLFLFDASLHHQSYTKLWVIVAWEEQSCAK